MKNLRLICNPSTEGMPVHDFTVDIDCRGNLLHFLYRIAGQIDELRLPAQARSAPADGLWQHTCFEAFLKTASSHAYYEMNFSPSSEWAIYRFDDYRQGMTTLAPKTAPKVICRRRTDRLEADVNVHLDSFAEFSGTDLQLAICAVLEDQAGQLSYWALGHPAGRPDFHHPGGFLLTLPRGSGAHQ